MFKMMKDGERETEKETEEKSVMGKERRDQNKKKIQNIVYQSQKRVRKFECRIER